MRAAEFSEFPSFRADEPVKLPPGVQPIKLQARNVDRRSIQKVFVGLRQLLNHGLVMPATIDGEPVRTNINVKKILKESELDLIQLQPCQPSTDHLRDNAIPAATVVGSGWRRSHCHS
jgi:hypothetical protein